MKYLVAILLMSCTRLVMVPAAATKAEGISPAAIGETFTIESKLLGERRTINVYLPPDYAKVIARYPVLYMPDGGMGEDFPHVAGAVDVSIKNGIIRPLIVVGIENTERRRDLAPPTNVPEEREAAPHAGGTARFRAFLRDELRPAIVERYRTTAETAIIGESLAGLFVLETLLVEPSLFDGYIAASPSVWWNETALVDSAPGILGNWTAGPKQLYVASAAIDSKDEAVETLANTLRRMAPPGLDWHWEHMTDQSHLTIYPFAALRGIRTIFAAPEEDE